MKNKITLALRITNFDCSPEEVTKLLGITPTRTFIKGNKVDKLNIEHKFSGWIVASGLHEHASFDEHIDSLIKLIETNLDLFTQICRQYTSVISCSVTIYNNQEHTPSIHLNEYAMKLFTQIGAEFDLDLYIR